MNTTQAISIGLHMVGPFRQMEESDFNALAAITTCRSAQKGDVLFTHGDPVQHLTIIMGGWVKLSRSTLDGAEAVLDVMSTGRMVGAQDLFGNGSHSCNAMVVEGGEILQVPAHRLQELVEHKPHLALAFLKELAHEKIWLEQELEGRTLQKAPQRLGCFLLRLVPTQQARQAQAVVLHLPFDKTLLAARLGMQPETFSRALANLKTELDLEVKGATITIPNVQQLVAYTCSACSGTFPCQSNCLKAAAS